MNKLSSNMRISSTCSRITRALRSNRSLFTSNSVLCNKNDDGDQNKENSEAEKPDPTTKRKEAEAKLQELLLTMSKFTTDPAPNVKIPRPREGKKAKYEEKKAKFLQEKKESNLGHRLEEAAKNVARSVDGDPQKTEEELLDLYLYGRTADQGAKMPKKEKADLKDVIGGMKIVKDTEPSRADQVRSYYASRPDRDKARSKPGRRYVGESVNIFGEEPFGFFERRTEPSEKPQIVLRTWNSLEERDLKLSVTHPPSNIFEQLIQWTDEGKIWRFPIDNEQDWIEEADVEFAEHVFLERHIEPWCPQNGPIRHFMELVCVGLSKNPYMSADEKRAHISFYENYFRSKNALLAELGIPEIPEKSAIQVAVE